MHYPVTITRDGNTYKVNFPDIPEALTGGDTYEEALSEAHDALVTAFEFYFEAERIIPAPSPAKGNQELVSVPASVWAKVLVLNEMVSQQLTKSALARRMGTRKQEVQRIVNLGHSTKIDTLSLALEAMGKRLIISAE